MNYKNLTKKVDNFKIHLRSFYEKIYQEKINDVIINEISEITQKTNIIGNEIENYLKGKSNLIYKKEVINKHDIIRENGILFNLLGIIKYKIIYESDDYLNKKNAFDKISSFNESIIKLKNKFEINIYLKKVNKKNNIDFQQELF